MSPHHMYEYRLTTKNSAPIGDKKMCSCCHQPRAQMGGKSIARPGSCKRAWICARCGDSTSTDQPILGA